MTGIEVGFVVSTKTLAEEAMVSETEYLSTLMHLNNVSDEWQCGIVGGSPIWLDFSENVDEDLLYCEVCETHMTFLLQLYVPKDTLEHAYHRAIFVFICLTSHEGNIKILRQQLTKDNPYYDCENPKHAHNDIKLGKVLTHARVIEFEAETISDSKVNETCIAAQNLFEIKNDEDSQISQDDLNKIVQSFHNEINLENNDLFNEFNRRISYFPGQIIRFCSDSKMGNPLIFNEKKFIKKQCESCREIMEFEFQIMPQIWSILNLEEPVTQIFDSLIVFSCPKSCATQNSIFSNEYAVTQFF